KKFPPCWLPMNSAAEPLMHLSLCPDKSILARLSGSFAPYPFSAHAGRHDDADVICLRQRVVNVMQSGCRVASHLREAATRGRKVDCLAILTRPVVPSTVSYVVRQQGNALSNAHGHRTHGHPTGTKTARGWCLYQHQVEMGLDGRYG